jgi:hypothetical protein
LACQIPSLPFRGARASHPQSLKMRAGRPRSG